MKNPELGDLETARGLGHAWRWWWCCGREHEDGFGERDRGFVLQWEKGKWGSRERDQSFTAN